LPSSTASTHSAPPKSFAWYDANGERGCRVSGITCATTPPGGFGLRGRDMR
jgi:hypothetical protein